MGRREEVAAALVGGELEAVTVTMRKVEVLGLVTVELSLQVVVLVVSELDDELEEQTVVVVVVHLLPVVELHWVVVEVVQEKIGTQML